MQASLVFKKILLISRRHGSEIGETLLTVQGYLEKLGCQVAYEQETASLVGGRVTTVAPDLIRDYDLLVVVGGDGSLLRASHIAVANDLPVLGINRGRMGFLTDIHPERLAGIAAIINGDYIEERRFLLELNADVALNEIVLLSNDAASRMIEFAIYIDREFVCNQRADGLIVATPTGSTAYALSGGGPILHPNLDAIALVPMFPHTLSSRPLVVTATSHIEITFDNKNLPGISLDGQKKVPLTKGGRVKITKSRKKLILIHPKDYCYFATLRSKLNWQNQ